MEPAVYPSDMRHTEYSSLKSVDTINKDTFSGYYLIEGFGSRIDTATIIIAPMSPTTSMPANYVLTVKPHTSPY